MKFYEKLVFRITLSISIPIIVITILITTLMYNNNYQFTLEKYTSNLETVNRDYVEFIDKKIHSIEEELLKDVITFVEDDFKNEKEVLAFTKNNIIIDSIIFGSAIIFDKRKFNKESDHAFFYSYRDGNEIKQISFQNKSDSLFFDYHNSKETWWDIPSRTYAPGWTDPYDDHNASKIDMITYFHPFFIEDEFSGVITLDISLQTLRNRLITNEKIIEKKISSNLFIISFDSIIIYTEGMGLSGQNIYKLKNESKRKFNLDESLNILDFAFNKQSGKTNLHSYKNDTLFLAVYSPFRNIKWTAINIIPYDDIHQNVLKQLSNILYYIFAFIVFLIVTIVFISRFISKPIVNLSHLSLQIASGNYDTLLDLKGKTEIGDLSRNFDKMQKEVKTREAEILLKNDQLLELDDAKNKFLLLISHEMRTPLNGIVGITSIIKDSIEDPELEEFIEMLNESVDRLDTFSKKALEITQMQTKGRSVEKEEVEIVTIIKNVCESYTSKIDAKKLTLNYRFDETNNLIINEKYFISAMDEIINNAVKFSFEATVIDIETVKEAGSFIIKVSNTGEVIPLSKTSEITKSFGHSKKHTDKNIGLGLSFVQSFVNIHQATLNITSNTERTVVSIHFKV